LCTYHGICKDNKDCEVYGGWVKNGDNELYQYQCYVDNQPVGQPWDELPNWYQVDDMIFYLQQLELQNKHQ
jgi:hypothetical protein